MLSISLFSLVFHLSYEETTTTNKNNNNNKQNNNNNNKLTGDRHEIGRHRAQLGEEGAEDGLLALYGPVTRIGLR